MGETILVGLFMLLLFTSEAGMGLLFTGTGITLWTMITIIWY